MIRFKIFKINISYIFHLFRKNTIKGAKKNIRAHYDMGNDFFEEWLDSNMQYSSAHFERDNQTLEEAQKNKFKKLENYLSLNDGEKLLEIGCGWGTLSQYLFNNNQIDIDAITISKEQLSFVKKLNIKDSFNNCSFDIKDYRNLFTNYNKIISIEMIEAVGEKYLPLYLRKIRECTRDDGFAIIQGITISDKKYKEYSNQVDFIQKYIFPGGFLPNKNTINKLVSNNGLTVNSYISYADHYANTLAIWRNEFNKKWDLIKNQGFDNTFKRMWEFYLSYCEAGFKSKNIDLIQFSLQNK